jgi:hypothetical protein
MGNTTKIYGRLQSDAYAGKHNEKLVIKNNGEITTAPTPKVYVALLTQTSTNAPVATVLENTLGTVTLTYEGTGSYMVVSNGLFTVGKTVVLIGNKAATTATAVFQNDSSNLAMTTVVISTGNETNGILENTTIEIRVYN